jgi:hypothetical protein
MTGAAMQVLEILSANEHRVVEHGERTEPPAGMKEWGCPYPAQLPFARVWAELNLSGSHVHEVINGYCPPPVEWPTHATEG